MASRAKATIFDIAREAGVSKSTVSLVLQGSGLIRPETAVKVRKAIEDVGYVYNRGAANLRKAHSNVIGMVINDLTNPFFAELAVGMERVFQSAGIVPFIANTAENPVRQEEVLKSLMEQGVAGLIVTLRPDLDAAAVLDVLRQSAKKIQPDLAGYDPDHGFSATYGYGRVDAGAAVSAALATPYSSR